jgi:multidrug efflux system membrane fusion protein
VKLSLGKALIAVFALLLAACNSEVQDRSVQGQLVRVAPVKQGRLQHELSFHGVLEPVTRARLAFQTPGVLASRPVQLGQIVQQGELLATLDNPELGPAQRSAAARLQESLTQRDQSKRDLARLRALAGTGAVGEEQVEQKEADLKSLEAAVARAEADLTGTRQRLQDATLLAPFDGVVSRISVEPGEFISAGQPVLAVGGMDRVEVSVLVPASLVSELTIGNRLEVRIPQLKMADVDGVVTELAAIGEIETGLFPVVVEISLDPGSTMVRAGMQAEVVFLYADVDGLILPLSAIVDPVGGDPHIFAVNGDRVRELPVRVTAMSGDEVAIELMIEMGAQANLNAGEAVVIAGHRSLTDGQEVRILQ